MREIELLFWAGCPSYPAALEDLRRALRELGRADGGLVVTEIASDAEAAERGFIGSPTIRVNGVDVAPPPPGEPTGLTCRIYRRRDGRITATPDPHDLRDALRANLARGTI